MWFLKLLGHLILITFLTALTQVGGLIWLITVFLSIKTKCKKRVIFPVFYLLFNLVLVPPIASYFGREKLPWFDVNLKPKNWFYPLAFRNYVKPELKNLLYSSSKASKTQITYLHGNFPFFDKFPLLPHLSHNDGKKIDLSFNYLNKNGNKTNKKPSLSGYGTYVKPNNLTTENCIEKGNWQYDFTKYITFEIVNDLKFDSNSTKTIIETLLSHSETQKVFIEPYLKTRLGLNDRSKISFHGCKAVRHDDHIHLQIK
ncbi:hypothetical protein [Winogradskyella sp. PG-2]|uniref:hypothetical protein n=1 Tax=Winogradskyella sp. PG-2 TaxID=754409 RepID=UPI0004586CB7|nr:hypothetical protein [Winogradskyella sp. PG-2]BAO74815.1 hypothetical protein WPG_0585 [Winogradskyella sp. PG-2]